MKKITFSLIAFSCFLNTGAFAVTGAADTTRDLVVYKGPTKTDERPAPSLTRSPSSWDMKAFKVHNASRFPVILGGYDELQRTIFPFAQTVRQNLMHDDKVLVVHNLLPQALRARAYVESMLAEYPQLKFFLAEIDFKIAGEAIDHEWLEFLGMRIAAAMSSTPSERTSAFARQYNGVEAYGVMASNYKSEHVSRTLFEESINPEKPAATKETAPLLLPKHLIFEADILDQILKIIGYRSEGLNVPLYGQAKMGLATLVETFNNCIYPYGVATEDTRAHGVQLTPFLFAFHDWLHSQNDQYIKNTELHDYIIYKATEIALRHHLNINAVALEIAKQARVKADMLMTAGNRLLDTYLKDFTAHQDEVVLRKAFIGLFMMIHEEFVLNSNNFKSHYFAHVIENLANTTIGKIQKSEDFQITNASSFIFEDVENYKSTNYAKIVNFIEDMAGLLNLIGFDLQTPEFTGDFETDKALAEPYMKAVQAGIIECVEFFRDTAQTLIENDAELGDGFTEQSRELEAVFLDNMNAMIKAKTVAEEGSVSGS